MAIPDTIEAATTAVGQAKKSTGSDDAYDANRAYVEDRNHFQDGKQWVGPQGDPAAWVFTKKTVERQFVAVDVIGEVLERVANALLRREADVSSTPVELLPEGQELPDAQKDELRVIHEMISGWWDRVKLWRSARQAVKRARWAGRGYLRLWIPPGRLQKGADGRFRAPEGLDMAGALAMIELSAPDPQTCAVYLDEETQVRYGVFLFTRGEKKAAEVWHVDAASRDTVLQVFVEGQDAPEEHRYTLGGLLPIVEIEGDLLITAPVRAQQNQLNYFSTVLSRVIEAAGFPERYVHNAQPHGMWLPTPPTDSPPLQEKQHGGRTYYLHPMPRSLGASLTTELVGLTMEETEGARVKRTFATPGVTFKEPTDPAFVIKAIAHARGVILRQCKQGHLVEDSTAEASGFAFIQARADFEADLDNTRGPAEGGLRDIIACAIAWAQDISAAAEGERYHTRYRTVVNLDVDTGPVTVEEQQQNTTAVEKGMLSKGSAMARNGVEDVEAELARIDQDPEAQLSIIERRSGVMATLMVANPSLSMVQAAIASGWEEADARTLFAEADAQAVQDRQGRQEIDDALRAGAGTPAE